MVGAKVLQEIALYYSNKIKFSQMQNFDVQLNLLLVYKALLVVLTMCLALLQWGQTLEKQNANTVRNIFHPLLNILLNIVNVFTMD